MDSDGKFEDNLTENNGSFTSGGTGNSIAALESKIKELQQKMVEVQRSNMPDATKEAMLSSIEAQVNAAIQELNALKTEAINNA